MTANNCTKCAMARVEKGNTKTITNGGITQQSIKMTEVPKGDNARGHAQVQATEKALKEQFECIDIKLIEIKIEHAYGGDAGSTSVYIEGTNTGIQQGAESS